ncbi:hypothetical protein [Bordetella flabilis]|uniref:Lipoprotein n=1 Tax=Bordetella flabilis TaxID=463014 RepID=A0A193GLV6_9BORD|nr:hypothetical protein [Bordetella flabilis]ANN80850.1 hypothetical protein BAU07_26370 [Bordetella flabilis]
MPNAILCRVLLCTAIVISSSLLSGCNDEKAAASSQPNADQAALEKHNADLARKNAVKSMIK